MKSELMAKYRHVFLNPMGQEVLTDILSELRFGCTLDPENTLQVCQHNVAVVLLNKIGILAEGTLHDVVNAFAGISPKEEETIIEGD